MEDGLTHVTGQTGTPERLSGLWCLHDHEGLVIWPCDSASVLGKNQLSQACPQPRQPLSTPFWDLGDKPLKR